MIGAFGLHAYGLTRATADVDFVADSSAQPRLIAFLEARVYEDVRQCFDDPPEVHASERNSVRAYAGVRSA